MDIQIQNLTDKLPKTDNPVERLDLLIKIQNKCLKKDHYSNCEKYAYESFDLSKEINDKEKELISLNSIALIKYFYAEYDNSMDLLISQRTSSENVSSQFTSL